MLRLSGKLDKIVWTILAIVAVLSTTSFSPPGQPINIGTIQPEVIEELLTGEELMFWVDVTLVDPDVTLTYEWEVDAGQILGEGDSEQILYVAPLQPGTVEIKVTVSDGSYQISTTKTVTIVPQVLPEPEPDQIYTIKEGDTLSTIAQRICDRRASDFPAIQYHTNLRCGGDERFDCIDDANLIEAGWNVYLPTCDAITYYWVDQLEMLPDIDWSLPGENINIAGDATLLPLTSRVAELFKSLGFDGHIILESSGAEDGFERLCNGEVDIVNVSRPMTDEELERCQQIGWEPIPIQVGTDALTIVVSTENDFIYADDVITLDDLRAILSTADEWSDVKPEWRNEDIYRFYPSQESDTFDFVVDALFEGDAIALLAATNVVTGADEVELVSAIAQNANAVGFFDHAGYWGNKESLVALNVSGQTPTLETVATGIYPLTRPLYIYAGADVMNQKPQIAAFINFYLRTARHVIDDLYFPLNEDELRESESAYVQAVGWIPGLSVVAPTPGATPTQEPVATPSPVSQEPFIGVITFAVDATEDNQPIRADTSFYADIEEIHAIFSYEGMSDGDTWERYWYQDGEEVGGGSDIWDAGESGTFDLSLSNDGQPLGSGIWNLEIYVNGELARTGTFVIEDAAPPSPTPQPATSTPPPTARTYQIAFSRWDGGKHDLYIANTDGGGERFLLERAAGPSWSPDGQYLSIYGAEGVDRQTRGGVEYVVEGITNGILRLKVANFPSDITQVEISQYVREGTGRWTAWAPNGDMVAFDAARGGPDRRIYFLGTADNQQYNIEIPGEQAAWSPNSNQVVYRSGRDGKQGIWISNRDDSGAHNITNEGNDSFPSWSPDGRSIAFHRDAGGNVDVYVMDTDGGDIRRLTDAPGPDTLPTWTPDGRIVFRSARSGSWGIYIMNADGSGQRQIIANADPGPDWAFGRMDVH
jgi:phosphate transport system substrate-binding protein